VIVSIANVSFATDTITSGLKPNRTTMYLDEELSNIDRHIYVSTTRPCTSNPVAEESIPVRSIAHWSNPDPLTDY
jgi:hypothetical protein